MALVRVRLDGVEKNLSEVVAKKAKSVEILDESTHNPDGSLRRSTRKGGRPNKPQTTVAKSAAAKKAVTATEPTPEGESK